MVTALAEADAEHRLLLIGTTNLDLGAGRVFDLGAAAHRATETEEGDCVASILIALAAIPGVFPPVELDGMLYADGGATSNLFVLSFPGRAGVFLRFLAARPGAPLPRIRVWVVVNQKLKPLHEVTQPRWISVAGRALATMTSTSQLFALALIRDLIHDIRDTWEVDIDGYLVSIPADAPDNETGNYFDAEYMRALDEIGRRMGADPSSWTQHIPSTYLVGQDWSFVEERTPRRPTDPGRHTRPRDHDGVVRAIRLTSVPTAVSRPARGGFSGLSVLPTPPKYHHFGRCGGSDETLSSSSDAQRTRNLRSRDTRQRPIRA